MDGALVAEAELRSGRTLGDVRVHTDSVSSHSARAVGAAAFTVGRDIVFAEGRYAPGSHEGRRLALHELAHVLQQRNAAIDLRRLTVDDGPGETLEREADAFSRADPRNEAVLTGAPHARVSRQQPSDTGNTPPAGGGSVSPIRDEGAGGCGPCIDAKSAGRLAHTEIQSAFLGQTSGAVERRVRYRGTTGRLDLIIESGRTVYIGEIKPDNSRGRAQGVEDLAWYIDHLARSRAYGDKFVRLMTPAQWVPSNPVGWMPHPTSAGPACRQLIYANYLGKGVYGYWCDPVKEVLESLPGCSCRPQTPLPPPARDVRDVRTGEKDIGGEGKREPGGKIIQFPPRPTPKPAEVEDEPGRKAAREAAFGVVLTALAVGTVYVAKRMLPRLALKLGLRAIPVVGLILLISDIALAADKLARGARFGLSGERDIPEGAHGVDAELMSPPEDIDPSSIDWPEVSPELVAILERDARLQQFMWEVARLKLANRGQPLTPEQLQQISDALRGADPENVRRILPLLRGGNDSSMAQLADAIAGAAPVPSGQGEPGAAAGSGSGAGRADPATGEPTRTPPAAAVGEQQAGVATGQPLNLTILDPYPNLKKFVNEFLAPAGGTTGTPLSPEFLAFLVRNAAALDDPTMLERLRASAGEGAPDLGGLERAIRAQLPKEVAAGAASASAGEGASGEAARKRGPRAGGMKGRGSGRGGARGKKRKAGRPGPELTTPRPFEGTEDRKRDFQYVAGIDDPMAVKAGDVKQLIIRFTGEDGQYRFSRVAFEVVRVITAKPRTIELLSVNTTALNIAPEGEDAFVIHARNPFTLTVTGETP